MCRHPIHRMGRNKPRPLPSQDHSPTAIKMRDHRNKQRKIWHLHTGFKRHECKCRNARFTDVAVEERAITQRYVRTLSAFDSSIYNPEQLIVQLIKSYFKNSKVNCPRAPLTSR